MEEKEDQEKEKRKKAAKRNRAQSRLFISLGFLRFDALDFRRKTRLTSSVLCLQSADRLIRRTSDRICKVTPRYCLLELSGHLTESEVTATLKPREKLEKEIEKRARRG